MKIIGLTGGIASGKSTVASILQKLGAHIFDADIASRQAVARGSQGLQQVIDVFGRLHSWFLKIKQRWGSWKA